MSEAAERPELCTPLRFERILQPRLWGGRRLEELLGLELPEGLPVGESWELCDRDDHNSVVADGPFAGRRLSGLMLTEGEAIMGRAKSTPDGQFPLLVKLLSADRELSIQVHPGAENASSLGVSCRGKLECWYILDAKPDSLLYVGLKPGVDAASFAEAAGTPAVVDLMEPWPVQAGEYIEVPPGMVHAIGAGVTLVEIQENSDTTFRIYDWGRLDSQGDPRDLHIDSALMAADYDTCSKGPVVPEVEIVEEGFERAVLRSGAPFSVERLHFEREIELDTGGLPVVYVAVAGAGTIDVDDGLEPNLITVGDTRLLPACVGKHRCMPKEGEELTLLRVEVEG